MGSDEAEQSEAVKVAKLMQIMAIFTSVPKCRKGATTHTRRHIAPERTQMSEKVAPATGKSSSRSLATARVNIRGRPQSATLLTNMANARTKEYLPNSVTLTLRAIFRMVAR